MFVILDEKRIELLEDRITKANGEIERLNAEYNQWYETVGKNVHYSGPFTEYSSAKMTLKFIIDDYTREITL